jgi:N-acetyl-gamma-glutamyl-phosphate reductase
MSKKIKVSIIGATGYTGLELTRLLIGHPHIKIANLTSSRFTGETISSIYPHLLGICDIELCDTSPEEIAQESDLVFLCLPHLQSQKIIPKIIGETKIIDLSGDFRIQNVNLFERYYKSNHSEKNIIPEFVYGLPEIHKEKIKKSNNVANIGCFAATTELALLPLKNFIKKVDILAITGSSGSGKTASNGTHHPVRNHNVKSYKIGKHQHIPEIIQVLGLQEDQINFVPTSGPFTRGIHLTAFAETVECFSEDIYQHYEKFYQKSPFVRIKNSIELVGVIGSNFVDISVSKLNNKIIIQCVLDNLVKGASGNAIQNMNLMFSFPENAGLEYSLPIYP